MPERPGGHVTFLFTDIEGSTRLWETHHDAMAAAVARHDALLRAAIEARGGYVFKTIGDAFCAAFQHAGDALGAPVTLQRALAAEEWGEVGAIRVRAALHAGAAEERDADYFGPTVNRVARLLAAGHGGQVLLSRAAADALGPLPDGVGLRDLGERRLRDLTRPERVYQLLAPGLAEAFPPLNSLDARPNNLPAQPTPLLGREQELGAVKDRLRNGARLLTLLGPGGTGKTRLALQAAADLIDDFPHGVWFVDLAAITEPALVAARIAGAFGLREEGGADLTAELTEHLRDKELLLVLDNFEQVLPAARLVADLLGAAPKLRVLVTSRAPLRVTGEQEYAVPPLPVPDPRRLPPVDHLEAYPSVELFVARARAVQPAFALSAEHGAAVAAICAELDGLPLAIELAAARVRLLPPAALLARLSSRLGVVTGGQRDRPERQQTLRGAIAWSYDLLPPEARRLLARLSVFAGGWTLAAAEGVTRGRGRSRKVEPGRDDPAPTTSSTCLDLLDLDVLEGLAGLAEHSLVRADEEVAGELRYRMLATIREFAAEQLEAFGEAEQARREHAEYFRALAEAGEVGLTGPEQGTWLARLEADHDNLRAALAYAAAAGDHALALGTAGALWRFWAMRGHLSEGRQHLEAALRYRAGMPPAVAARALEGAGCLTELQGDGDHAKALLEEALALQRAIGDRAGVGRVLVHLGNVDQYRGLYADAAVRYDEGLAAAREAGDRRTAANALSCLGDAALWRGDYDRAHALLMEGLGLAREIEDARGVANNLTALGILADRRGDLLEAVALHEEARHLWQRLGDVSGSLSAALNLANALRLLGDLTAAERLSREAATTASELGLRYYEAIALNLLRWIATARDRPSEAVDLFERSLDLASRNGDRELIPFCLEGLAIIAVHVGDGRQAARLFGAAERLREEIGAPLPHTEQATHDRALERLQALVGFVELAAAWENGRNAGTNDLLHTIRVG